MFHVSDNLFFERLEDGSVKIIKYPADTRWDTTVDDGFGTPSNTPIFEQTIDASSWASVVSSVSAGNEEDGRFYTALEFHASKGAVKVVAA